MGIETSVPFGCTQKLGVPDLSARKATIDRQLDEVRKMGVTQMELVNKFDNALSGVAGDEGSTGYLVNTANTLETGSPWRMQTCKPNDPEVHDKDQDNSVPRRLRRRPGAGRALRCGGQGLRACTARRCPSTRPSTTATRSA